MPQRGDREQAEHVPEHPAPATAAPTPAAVPGMSNAAFAAYARGGAGTSAVARDR
jgi:hypothetical protein